MQQFKLPKTPLMDMHGNLNQDNFAKKVKFDDLDDNIEPEFDDDDDQVI